VQTNKITFNIHRASFLLDRIADRALQDKFALTYAQFRILMAIDSKKNLSQKDIASFWEVSEAAVSRQLENLKGKALIACQEDRQNRRKNVLALTQKGREQLLKSYKLISQRYQDIYKVIDAKTQDQLVGNLEKLVDSACFCSK